jgi:hypothetical protein
MGNLLDCTNKDYEATPLTNEEVFSPYIKTLIFKPYKEEVFKPQEKLPHFTQYVENNISIQS